MVIGVCRLTLDVPESLSLKDKRGPVRSLVARLRSTFNVAVAEVDALDSWQTAVLGLAVVSHEQAHANAMLDKIVHFVEENLDEAVLADYTFEFIHSD